MYFDKRTRALLLLVIILAAILTVAFIFAEFVCRPVWFITGTVESIAHIIPGNQGDEVTYEVNDSARLRVLGRAFRSLRALEEPRIIELFDANNSHNIIEIRYRNGKLLKLHVLDNVLYIDDPQKNGDANTQFYLCYGSTLSHIAYYIIDRADLIDGIPQDSHLS